MIVASRREIRPDEARLLVSVRADVSLGRAAFAGVPFHIQDEKRAPGQPRSLFSEELVLRMIAAGLLHATQITEPWPGRDVPARPFTVLLTKDGEKERLRLLRRHTVVANDDATQTGRAA